VLAAGSALAQGGQVVDGLAIVRDDGVLAVGGHKVRLFGIFLPQGERTCRTWIRPPVCAPQAVLVLKDKVDGFVRCEIVGRGADGVVEGVCSVRGRDLFGPRQDLGAYLLQEGWALVTPEAPPVYHALEQQARARELGLWNDQFLRVR
jgi:endonuclease YncB( thermonuclease family)